MLLEIILIVFIFLLFFLLCFYFLTGSIKAFFTGAPPVPTPKKEIVAGLKEVEINPRDTFFDLGSGTGKVVLIADKMFRAKAVGIESSFFMYFFSKLNLFIKGSNGKIIRKNFFKASLEEADIIYIYGSMKLMKSLEKHLLDISGKRKIISYCFSFPNIKPIKKIKRPSGKFFLIYEI